LKTLLNIFASFLLLFNGTGALYGGWNLITHPDGSSLQLPLQLLNHTPFDNYFIPGVILFIANGLFSIATFVVFLLRYRNYAWFVVAQGLILTGWIAIQVVLIQTINFLHMTLGLTGISMIASGLLLKRLAKEAIKQS
jgi:hypothetical protein